MNKKTFLCFKAETCKNLITEEFYLRDVLSCFSEQLACEQLASAELPVRTANCCWLVSTVSLAARGYYDNKLCLICICFGVLIQKVAGDGLNTAGFRS